MSREWRILSKGGGLVRIGPEDGTPRAVVGGYGTDQAVEDGRRIVAALNYCAGKLTAELETEVRQRRLEEKKA